MAVFYRQEIELLNKKGSLIKELNKSKELLTNYSNNVWSVDETLFNKIKIKAEIIAQIKTLLLNQKKEQSQLDDADKVLAQMTKARRGLIKEFYNAAESGKFDKNKCPLCGTDFTDIDLAIIETEQFIKNIHTDGIKIIEDIETQITNLFQKEIIPVLKVFLEENKVLIKMDDTLSGCKDLAVEKLQQLLDKVKISEFKSQGIEKFDIEEFSQQYENLLKELQEKEVPNKIIFQEKQIELYKSIHNTYYHNEKPYHTVGELQSKEQYVAKLFNDNLSLQLSTEEARLRKLKRDYEEYKKKTEDMTDAIKVLVGKYEDANKEYQTQLLNAIKIPLMVYSGRIIQNYPLGLGIRAIIKTNQLVFEAASKSGTDKVLYDLFGWLYIGKFNPNKKEFESSNILKDANYQYRIKEIHTQNVFGKFVPEDAGEGCEDTVIFSDEYFDKQWEKQAADDEEVSMLEAFSFPKTKEQMAWKEIKDHADKEGITVFQPDDSHSPHAICYDKTVFLKEQKASNIFLLFSKLFILITLLISGTFIMVVKNLAEMSSYQRRYEFFHSMGMKQKEQKKILSFEICSVANIALGTGICLALLYVMTYLHWYDAMGEKISTTFWSYWLKLVGIYIIIQIVVQKLFVRYVNKRI